MTVTVYPPSTSQPTQLPLAVAAMGVSTPQAIVETVGSYDFGGFDGVLPAMVIRVTKVGSGCAAPGGSAPTITLQAGNGMPVNLSISTPDFQPIFNPTLIDAAAVGQARMQADPAGNNVYIIPIAILVSGSSWTMTITNNDPAPASFTWVVGANDAESLHPWIDVQSTLDFESWVSQSMQMPVSVRNFGTGPLTINDAPGPLGSGFSIVSVPGSIPPNQCADILIEYSAPAAAAEANVAYVISSNDTTSGGGGATAEHNWTVNLSAVARECEIGLVLDASGSMNVRPDGTPAAVPSDSRWSKLQSAASGFLSVLAAHGVGKGSFGMAVFPDVTASPVPPSSAGDVQARMPINNANITTADAALTGLSPDGWTPMGDGIEQAMSNYFDGGQAAQLLNRRRLVLMSDGAHNQGPPDPSDFYAGPNSFVANKVQAIAVAYGDPGAWEVDHNTLNNVAGTSLGTFLDAGVNDTGANVTIDGQTVSLQKAFLLAIADCLDLDSSVDPADELNAAVREKRYPVDVLPYDRSVTFFVSWNTADADRIRIQLMTPNCELITPEMAAGEDDIRFDSNARFATFTVGPQYLRNASNPKHPRYGRWTLIASAGFDGRQQERFEYDVMVDSTLKMALSFNKAEYAAGDPIGVRARLSANGRPIEGGTIRVKVTTPALAHGNWLAAQAVTAEQMSMATQTLAGRSPSIYQVKAEALRQSGVRFMTPSNVQTIELTEVEPGEYHGEWPATAVTGSYEFYAVAHGITADGVNFRREKRRQLFVRVEPEPSASWIDVLVDEQMSDGPHTHLVKLWPRDRFGNMVLVDPAQNPVVSIRLDVTGAEPVDRLRANLDGSYSLPIILPDGVTPTIGASYNGRQIIEPRPVAQPGQNMVLNELLDLQIGPGASADANQFVDSAALFDADRATFLALGAFGSVTLGMRDRVIVPNSKSSGPDFIVFVHAADRLRRYSVSVRPAGQAAGWVKVGESPGVTQAFRFGNIGIQAIDAIRVVDMSGRVFASSQGASKAPGVNLVQIEAIRTQAAADVQVEQGQYRIRGRVVDVQSRQPVSGVFVTAIDKDLFFDDTLGTAETDYDGRFTILYTAADFQDWFETRPDIMLRVAAADGQPMTQQAPTIRWNATSDEFFTVYVH